MPSLASEVKSANTISVKVAGALQWKTLQKLQLWSQTVSRCQS